MDSIHKQSKQEGSWITKSSAHVHYNSEYPIQLGAKAFTYGNDIYLGKGAESTYLHELGHVIQQQNKEVEPQGYIRSVPININQRLENKADNNRDTRIIEKDIAHPVIQMAFGYTVEEIKSDWSAQGIVEYTGNLVECISEILTKKRKKERFYNRGAKNLYDQITSLLKCACTPYLHIEEAQAAESPSVNFGKKKMNNSDMRTKFKQRMLLDILKSTSEEDLENALQKLQYEFVVDTAFDSVKEVSEKGYVETTFVSLADIRFVFSREFLHSRKFEYSRENISRFDQALDILYGCCRKKDVKKVILGCNINVVSSFIRYDAVDDEIILLFAQAANAFLRRLELTAKYINQIYIDKNCEFWIIPSGSDPHKDGKQALFLENKQTGLKTVYKQRSLEPDNALVGQNGIISTIELRRKSDRKVMQLPSMDIHPDTNEEEFVISLPKEERAAVMQAKAIDIFYQFGMIDIITKLLGIGDLHTDNFIITENGPILIDAEVSFATYGDNLMNGSDGPLNRANSSDGLSLAASTFYIKDSKGIRMSQIAYKDVTSPYQQSYQSGRQEMIEYMRSPKTLDTLMDTCRSCMKNITTVRIVPISTVDLSIILDTFVKINILDDRINYIVNSPETYPRLRAMILGGTFIFNANKDFTRHNFRVMMLSPEENAIEKFYNAFDNGTLPCFEFNLQNGDISLDETPIAKVTINPIFKKSLQGKSFYDILVDNIAYRAHLILSKL